ncbi:MAG: LysM peptidoglycan-binding domain-containing protein [Bacilli bacterium]|nr:LysM peptidoglycan-binding domain-containing protein [Bacilli bacterium]
MKKIIPFVKEITFNTDVYEINSISLEHNLKLKNENMIDGEFIISGDYKESEIVISNEPFIYNIPFSIDLDCKYQTDNIKIEIDDFNYDLINNNTLKISINLSVDGVEVDEVEILDEVSDDERNNNLFKEDKKVVEVEDKIEQIPSVLNNISFDDEMYVNYHVHIYRENDTLENIIKLYNTSKDDLEEYNDLSNITIGSKIIVPNNEQL